MGCEDGERACVRACARATEAERGRWTKQAIENIASARESLTPRHKATHTHTQATYERRRRTDRNTGRGCGGGKVVLRAWVDALLGDRDGRDSRGAAARRGGGRRRGGLEVVVGGDHVDDLVVHGRLLVRRQHVAALVAGALVLEPDAHTARAHHQARRQPRLETLVGPCVELVHILEDVLLVGRREVALLAVQRGHALREHGRRRGHGGSGGGGRGIVVVVVERHRRRGRRARTFVVVAHGGEGRAKARECLRENEKERMEGDIARR